MPQTIAQVDPHQLAAMIRAHVKEIGFDLVGIAPAGGSAYRDYLRNWLEQGRHGSMNWLAGRFAERTDPAAYLPGAKSVICVACNYYVPLDPNAARDGTGKVARYALGEDYHEVMKGRLRELADWIRSNAPGALTRAAVDTAPVMEKELAARAGIGWLGKNCCIINEQIGSWVLLGEVITTLDLPRDEPAVDRCGSCTRCIEACPTGAITGPYQLDARKCISYLTIEHRGEIDPVLRAQVGDWLYGCDICQDVCPWNSKATPTADPSFAPRFAGGVLDARRVVGWDEEEYRRTLKGSAMKRVKLPVLQRNARIVLENAEHP
jgi:epoxyqueuosine reductase